MMLSFTRIMASARRRAWSVGLRRIKNVRRWAVFTPTPGNFENSSISAATGGAILLISSTLEQTWNPHATGHATNHFLLGIRYLVKGIFRCCQHHDLQFGNILWIKG